MLRRQSPNINRSSVAASATIAAETISDNEDLLLQILIHLPIRSILKFKCVSKGWRSLLSSRRFSQHHRSSSEPLSLAGIFLSRPYQFCNPPVVDFISLGTNPSRAPCKTLDSTGHTVILQSCNGLLLCEGSDKEVFLNRNPEDYYVHNPTTKHFWKIPYPVGEDGERESELIMGVSLAFDPSRSSSNYEFVFVQYLGIFSNSSQNRYRIRIYSSESGRWRIAHNNLNLEYSFKGGVYWKRAIHWFSNWESYLYLDLSEDKLHELPMPRVPDRDRDERRIEYYGDCGGHLYLIERYCLKLDVWEMQDDDCGWFVKYHVDLGRVCAAYPKIVSSIRHFSVLGMIDESDDKVNEKAYLIVLVVTEIIRLNVESGRFERVRKDSKVGPGIGLKAYLFNESLACV